MLLPHNNAEFSQKLTLKTYIRNLVRPDFSIAALQVALVVGSILFMINHGEAFLMGQMTQKRWVATVLSYITPYAVSIHGQSQSQMKQDQ